MMKLESSRDIPLPREDVWKVINDLEVLKRCIPGCELLEKQDDDSLTATVLAKIGPVSAKFRGNMTFENVAEPASYRIVFSGQGGTAGFAKGHADVHLEPIETGTRLHYSSEASIGGKLAQIGSRLVEGTARKLSDDFFSRLEAETRVAHPATENLNASEPALQKSVRAEDTQKNAPFAYWKWIGVGLALVGLTIVLLASQGLLTAVGEP